MLKINSGILNRIVLIIGLIVSVHIGFAQQIPLLSNYYYLPQTQNPSLAGIGKQTKLFGIYKTQLSGLPERPVMYAYTMETPWVRNKAGMGLSMYQETQGISSRIGGHFSSSYRFKVSRFQSLSLGLGVGMLAKRINFNEVVVKDYDDPFLVAGNQSKPQLDANFGLSFMSRKMEIGFAMPQFLANPEEGAVVDFRAANRLSRHYMLSLKYDFVIDILKQISFKPMLLVRTDDFSNMQYDLHGVITLKDYLWLGVLKRSGYGTSFNIGTKLAHKLTIGYSYDWVTTQLAKDVPVKLSHEIILGYSFGGNKNKDFEFEEPKEEEKTQLFEPSASDESKEKEKEEETVKKKDVDILEEEVVEKEDIVRNKPKKEESEILEEDVMLSRRIFRTRPIDDFEKPDGTQEERGYYLIIGSFKIKPFADRAVTVRKATGYPNANYTYSKTSKYNYVYLNKFDSMETAMEQLAKMQNGEFPDCWVLGLEK